ncbi:hypothetical protein ACIF80_09640 [Streptomyces sp. NPDC085927]|uniref:hypothetical protein n=1 Tax=Streptomyces sp. NPDC085927 TaxID=3365738 RepID=UPI0037D5B9F6
MKWLLLGALLGLLLTIPQALAVAVTVVTVLASQPLLVAFAAGILARPYLPLVGRWTR